MTHEFKVGDHVWMPAVVAYAKPDADGEIKVTHRGCRADNWNFISPAKLVRAIPTPDHLTELERRVVEAAVVARKPPKGALYSDLNLWNAVDALLAARAPKDPLTIATDALRSIASCETHAAGDVVDIARRAIASIEQREAAR